MIPRVKIGSTYPISAEGVILVVEVVLTRRQILRCRCTVDEIGPLLLLAVAVSVTFGIYWRRFLGCSFGVDKVSPFVTSAALADATGACLGVE